MDTETSPPLFFGACSAAHQMSVRFLMQLEKMNCVLGFKMISCFSLGLIVHWSRKKYYSLVKGLRVKTPSSISQEGVRPALKHSSTFYVPYFLLYTKYFTKIIQYRTKHTAYIHKIKLVNNKTFWETLWNIKNWVSFLFCKTFINMHGVVLGKGRIDTEMKAQGTQLLNLLMDEDRCNFFPGKV